MLLSPSAWGAQRLVAIRADVSPAESSLASVVVVEVSNDDTQPVTVDSLFVRRGVDNIATKSLAITIAPHRSIICELPYGNASLVGARYVVVTYRFAGEPPTQEYSMVSTPSAKSAPSAPWYLALVGPVLGLVGVAAGALIVHATTARRENRKVRFDWHKMLYEKHADRYTEFLSTLGSHFNATLLEQSFATLRRSVPVSSSSLSAFERTVAVLRDGNASADSKKAALGALNDQLLKEMSMIV
jgi:hypothetical protein